MKARANWQQRIAKGLVGLAVATAGLFGVANSAVALPTGRILIKPCLNFHTDATYTSPQVGCIPYNTTVAIDCTKTGPSVTGPYGAENIWDHTTYAGKTGFVADAWVYTGHNGAVAPTC